MKVNVHFLHDNHNASFVSTSVRSTRGFQRLGTVLVTDRMACLAQPDHRIRPQGAARSLQCHAMTPQSAKLDSSLIWGDIMMLTATELASERLPKDVTGVLGLTLLAAWIGVAAAKGDYTIRRRHESTFDYMAGVWLGMQQAAITWLLFVPTSMAIYACLISHHVLDSSAFVVPPGDHTSPEGEVMMAALFTLVSWRGIYLSQMF